MGLQEYFAQLGRGVDLVAECSGLSAPDLEKMGASAQDAAELIGLHTIYFGPTPYSGKQRSAVNSARRNGHTLSTLHHIESFTRRVKEQRAAWNLRVELCATPSEQVTAVARRRLREMRAPREYCERVLLRQHPNGLATLTVTGNGLDMADAFRTIDHKRPGESFIACMLGKAGPAARTRVTTMAVLQLEDYGTILRRERDDVVVRTTSGAVITGAQLVERACANEGLVTIISRTQGPVDLYRFDRFASVKQRTMLAAEHPTCAWPGCNTPAERGQFHHLTPWKHGGETNVANLVTLCSYHNGINEDDPNAPPRRGRLTRQGGTIVWQPPHTSR
ncbi:HNH endonuclease signature motif containing protein [Corynebacterium flavescens]|uniref:HNH endonuclease signature motif containing protein n=5 Tax=Corynebacterium flavescens TaxID=28028 RepID=UPI0026470A33|nr:HNH endonuclease signature motif containing protein [Corynebacterium flavescens]MDN6198450.1 HNH endonuclease [Corynebacterium flavescens]